MDVDLAARIKGDDQHVLKLIEASAQEQGNLSVANEARYALLSLQGSDRGGVSGFMDRVFYRGVSGYLVRPIHPLVALLALLTAGGLVRSLRRWSSVRASGLHRRNTPERRGLFAPIRRALLVAQRSVATFLARFLRQPPGRLLGQAPSPHRGRRRGRLLAYAVAGARWVEFLAYKVLVVVTILAIGNARATVRQVIDAVRT